MFCLGSTQWVEVKVESLLQHFAEPEVVRFVGEDEGESEVGTETLMVRSLQPLGTFTTS